MKAAFLALSVAAIFPVLSIRGQSLAPTPYVETTTLTFFWGFSESYQSNSSKGVPALPEIAALDPETLPSDYATDTDTLKAQAYTGPVAGTFPPAGANKQIIDLLLQRMVRNGRISTIALDYRWQIIAVREAPANVHELATNPYRVFLAGQYATSSKASPIEEISAYGSEKILDAPLVNNGYDTDSSTLDSVTVDTGMTITLGNFSGSYVETNWATTNNKVRNASGTVSTAFTVNFGSVFYEDPKHNFLEPKTDPEFNYHLKRNYWNANASGIITYNIKSILGPLPTFLASTASATATGWFTHGRDEVIYNSQHVPSFSISPLKTYGPFGGVAPLKVNMSTIQYQKRSLFVLDLPTAPGSVLTTTLSDTKLSVSWLDRSRNETRFLVERRDGLLGSWTEIAPAEANNSPTYIDTDLTPDSVYYYRIRAENGAGASAYSSIGAGTTVATPTRLEATATLLATTINLKWTDNSGVETGFVLERSKTGEANSWSIIASDIAADETTYADINCAPSTKYFYRIRAQDAIGYSAYSNVDSTTTPAAK